MNDDVDDNIEVEVEQVNSENLAVDDQIEASNGKNMATSEDLSNLKSRRIYFE